MVYGGVYCAHTLWTPIEPRQFILSAPIYTIEFHRKKRTYCNLLRNIRPAPTANRLSSAANTNFFVDAQLVHQRIHLSYLVSFGQTIAEHILPISIAGYSRPLTPIECGTNSFVKRTTTKLKITEIAHIINCHLVAVSARAIQTHRFPLVR